MAIAIRPEFVDPPDDHRQVAQLADSIETLLADYLRRSMLRREHDVPLSTLLRDMRAVLATVRRP